MRFSPKAIAEALRDRDPRFGSVELIERIVREHCGDSCLAKVAEGEPIFVLRAQDATAPTIVEAWALNLRRVEDHRAIVYGDAKPTVSTKPAEALDLAAEMRKWPNRKLPD